MTVPKNAEFVIIGAGIHGLSTAWHLAKIRGRGDDIVVIDKAEAGAGASGIACGVVRNNYFQSAMRELMAHSVKIWEENAEAFHYHSVGYLQISHEGMRSDVEKIYSEQKNIGYESDFIVGEKESMAYMRGIFDDWHAPGVTSVLHEKHGGYANNMKSVKGLVEKATACGVQICSNTNVSGFERDNSGAVCAVLTADGARIACGQVVVAAGPWVKTFWDYLQLPNTITVKNGDTVRDDIAMWRYWALQEGTLGVSPDFLTDNNGNMPPVVHLDSNEPLIVDGKVVRENWGIYYKPDYYFNGVQGGAAPYEITRTADEVQVDPYGPNSPEFIVGKDFAEMWTAALAFAQKRFVGQGHLFAKEPSGGIGCFTADSFPIFDRFCDNVYFIADSNHGYKMLGVGALVAEELCGKPQQLLQRFRFARYAAGDLHETSNSPFPWS
ncbi:MAG: FAD-binding oxidoreductase [Proteobacteria bacterium]|nr:FAD-binding oxidoreductase [Pseudomonadota bacterium]